MIIKEAAIIQDGKIYTGKRHHLIIKDMVEICGLPKPIKGESGFTDELGNFIDRETAAKIALENGQIKELLHPPNLYSEEIIPL